MGLTLAIIVAVGTILLSLLMLFANGMTTAPSQHSTPLWSTLIVGLGIAAVLAFSHYSHFSW